MDFPPILRSWDASQRLKTEVLKSLWLESTTGSQAPGHIAWPALQQFPLFYSSFNPFSPARHWCFPGLSSSECPGLCSYWSPGNYSFFRVYHMGDLQAIPYHWTRELMSYYTLKNIYLQHLAQGLTHIWDQ